MTAPPAKVLELVAPYIGDAGSVFRASCVSSSWKTIFTENCIWKTLCESNYPCSEELLEKVAAPSPFHLFRPLRIGKNPSFNLLLHDHIAMDDLNFTVDIFRNGTNILSFVLTSQDLDISGPFMFSVNIKNKNLRTRDGDRLKVVWMVVLKTWQGAMTLCDGISDESTAGMILSNYLPELPCLICRTKTFCSVVHLLWSKEQGRMLDYIDNIWLKIGGPEMFGILTLNEALYYLRHFL